MTPWPVTLRIPDFEAALLDMLSREGHIRLSGMLVKLWCGSETPTSTIREWATAHGFEIVPGADFAGGWEVRAVRAKAEEWQQTLFG